MKTIYLAGPINGRSDADCKNWRDEIEAQWPKGLTRNPMARDYRGRELLDPDTAQEIVEGDLEDIDACDALVVYFDRPSVGTSMEVFYAAHVRKMEVVIIDQSGAPLSPWLFHHATAVVATIEEALAFLR